ncbi:MAG: penicillin-binding transpeptidase domain-containing protein [Propioniciclava sp.]|uniref:peptidoglycan D,D-transpeptidase FtsI family protein n=1 Tax=Propioniciclava sp. TaxID=2038686 RepID=UPI0039E679E8
MNGPIRRVSLVVMLMFLALVVNSSYAYLARTDSLNRDPANRRVRDAQFGVDRGDILVGNTPVVTSTPVDTRFAFQRGYAQGALYAPVTGFYSFEYGGSGLEQYYSARLSGTADSQFLQNVINTATGKRPQGDSLQTTLDARAQRAAAQALGNRPGAVVALDYTTGAVKALVSTPSFDPNDLASHDLNVSRAAWKKLTEDPAKPMANRAVREIYPPGSTFKLVVSAAALESGMTPDSMVDSPASLTLPGSTFQMTGSCGGEQITLKQALRVSCNTAFANLGSTLGDDALRAQAQRFGFGSTQLPELSGVASRFPSNPDAAQTMLSSIGGFDVAASPLQMAMVAAAIANDGVLFEPYLVEQMRGPDLNVTSTRRPNQLSLALAPANARALQDMMVDVVENGTGRRAQISGVRVGGKTGTALTSSSGDSSGRVPYAWFVAFADDPAIAVAVFVQDAGVDGSEISGGRYAAPIAQAVIESMR